MDMVVDFTSMTLAIGDTYDVRGGVGGGGQGGWLDEMDAN